MQPHPFDGIDLREQPEHYRIGRGEYGLFHAQPYKSELLPLWRFKTPDIAEESAQAIYAKYEEYRAAEDFVGMDVARKYIQMGYTRSRRYAKYPGGRKYNDDGSQKIVDAIDPVKQASAEVFQEYLDRIKADEVYRSLKQAHRADYGT